MSHYFEGPPFKIINLCYLEEKNVMEMISFISFKLQNVESQKLHDGFCKCDFYYNILKVNLLLMLFLILYTNVNKSSE